MKLDPQVLQKIARLTLEHYNRRAKEFWEGTRDHNVSQNIEALPGRIFRWHVRQRRVVSRPEPGAAARVAATAHYPKTGWRARGVS
jgi:hypothetical protein